MEKITYKLKEKAGKPTLPEKLGFGIYFSDHVFEMDYAGRCIHASRHNVYSLRAGNI
jgi:hypothetical protein